MPTNFFADLSRTLGAELGANLLSKSAAMIAEIAPLFQAAFGIYVLFVIYGYYGQSGTVSLADFVKRASGWVVLIGLAFSPALYMKLAQIIYGMPDEFASLFSGTSFNASAMDVSWAEVQKVSDHISTLHKEYQWYEIPIHGRLLSMKFWVTLCAAVTVGISFAFYMVAKISLALVLMLGSFFIGCLLFPSTRQYGMNWIGQCLNYIITCSLLVLATSVQMQAFNKVINMAASSGTLMDAVALEAVIPVLILISVIFLIIIWCIPSIASALTGGAAVQAMARNLSAMAGGASRIIGNSRPGTPPRSSGAAGGNISPTRPSRRPS